MMFVSVRFHEKEWTQFVSTSLTMFMENLQDNPSWPRWLARVFNKKVFGKFHWQTTEAAYFSLCHWEVNPRSIKIAKKYLGQFFPIWASVFNKASTMHRWSDGWQLLKITVSDSWSSQKHRQHNPNGWANTIAPILRCRCWDNMSKNHRHGEIAIAIVLLWKFDHVAA